MEAAVGRVLSDVFFVPRTRFIFSSSFDASFRLRFVQLFRFFTSAPLGEPLRSVNIAEVIDSKGTKFKVGDRFQNLLGWADYMVVPETHWALFSVLP
jgi:NADPH-dependent curcumin reductase CurA